MENTKENLDSISLYMMQAANHRVLSREEEYDLIRKMHESPTEKERMDARDQLVQCNQRLVVSIVKSNMGRGVEFLDLIEEANLGLLTAIDYFDVKQNTKLSTYATYWINQKITRYIEDKRSSIRVPVYLQAEGRQLYKCREDYKTQHGEYPSTKLLSELTGVEIKHIKALEGVICDPMSLEYIFSDSENTPLMAFVEDEKAINPEITAMKSSMRDDLLKILDKSLTEKEKNVILYRMGFVEDRIFTLEEVGSRMGVTRERIRQIEARALQKLQNPKYKRILEDYLEIAC